MDVNSILLQFTALAGFGALIAIVINIGKVVGFVKDGTSQNWNVGLNILGMVLLFALQVFRPDMVVKLPGWDAIAASVAQVATLVLGIVTQIGTARLTNFVVKGMPVVGRSYSLGLVKPKK